MRRSTRTADKTQLDKFDRDKLSDYWKSLVRECKNEAKRNPELTITAPTQGCKAVLKLRVGGKLYEGVYPSCGIYQDVHAEIQAIHQATVRDRVNPENIESIEITREPCPVCAAILVMMGLALKVKYKDSGSHRPPSWKWPPFNNVGQKINFAEMLVGGKMEIGNEKLAVDVISYFSSSDWY